MGKDKEGLLDRLEAEYKHKQEVVLNRAKRKYLRDKKRKWVDYQVDDWDQVEFEMTEARKQKMKEDGKFMGKLLIKKQYSVAYQNVGLEYEFDENVEEYDEIMDMIDTRMNSMMDNIPFEKIQEMDRMYKGGNAPSKQKTSPQGGYKKQNSYTPKPKPAPQGNDFGTPKQWGMINSPKNKQKLVNAGWLNGDGSNNIETYEQLQQAVGDIFNS